HQVRVWLDPERLAERGLDARVGVAALALVEALAGPARESVLGEARERGRDLEAVAELGHLLADLNRELDADLIGEREWAHHKAPAQQRPVDRVDARPAAEQGERLANISREDPRGV